jgi:hypothetical protein
MMDGSIIKADAALKSLVEKPQLGEKIKDKKSQKYIKGKKFSNKTHVSKTDPDATLAGKVGELKKLAYKVHDIIERKSRIVIDSYITTGTAMEGTIMMKRIEQTQSDYNIKIKEVTADRGYGYGENLQDLNLRNIKSFVPRFHPDAGDRVARDSAGFSFNKKNDCYICPKGYSMYPIKGPTPDYIRYRMTGGHCSACLLKDKCLNLQNMKTRGAKHIEVSIYQNLFEKTAKMEKTSEFKKIRGERQWKMEGIFAEAKDQHGLARARYHGLKKMQIQTYLVSFVQNIMRLLELVPNKTIILNST